MFEFSLGLGDCDNSFEDLSPCKPVRQVRRTKSVNLELPKVELCAPPLPLDCEDSATDDDEEIATANQKENVHFKVKANAKPPSFQDLPPTKHRRTQSLAPELVLNDELNSNLDISTSIFPTFRVKTDSFNRISAHTLVRMLDGEFPQLTPKIIDCRFEYEFEGGHIPSAVNLNTTKQIERLLTNVPERTLLIFHCEHSAYRSPLLANHLRRKDREVNAHRYPELHFPNIVVLDGGYSGFFELFGSRCIPKNYIGMNHEEHLRTCKREMQNFRTKMKAHKCPSVMERPMKLQSFSLAPKAVKSHTYREGMR